MHLQWKVRCFLCYGDEENARIYAVHLTTADQSGIRRAYLVSVVNKKKQVPTTF